MKDRVSPTFIAAGVVIGLACFILLSMLFYDTVDYYERADEVATADGFRFSVANAFFRSLGIGAYLGWMVILAWGIVIFFREKVGDLALRGASLVVVVVSGAALASLMGANEHGGDLGTAVGSILSAGLGSTLGAIVMIAIFGASFLYATDYGFFRYVRQAREAVAVLEVDPEEDEEIEEDRPTDWSKLIDQTVTEVTETPVDGIDEELEEELLAETPEPEEPAAAFEEEPQTSEPMVLNFRAIETEDLDEDLLVSGESEAPVAVTPGPAIVIEEEAEDSALATEEPLEETTAEVFLEEDILLSDEVAETAREMLAALEVPVETPVGSGIETTVEAEDDTAFAEGLDETPVAEEEEETVAEAEEEEEIPVATVEILEDEEEVETVAEAPEPVREEATAPAPGDVHSVFDALLGFAPPTEEAPAEAPAEPTNGTATPVVEVEEVAAEEEDLLADEEIEEPGFILTDDVIVVENEVPEPAAEAPAAVEEEPAPAAIEPAGVEPAPVEPAERAENEREEMEREVVEEIQEEEVTGDVFVEQVILVDERLDQATDGEMGAAEDDEAPLFPFMDEEIAPEPVAEAEPVAETEPEPAVESEAETAEEIPVLEDVSLEGVGETGKRPSVLRSIFGKKDKSAVRPGDPLLDESAALVIEKGRASVVFLQRRLDIGYTRASRLIDAMERNGLVGPLEESGSREVLMATEEWEELRG